MRNEGRHDRTHTRSPLVKRLPTVGALALALILAALLGHSPWVRVGIYLGTFVACMLILHFVLRQPLERLLRYKELDDQ